MGLRARLEDHRKAVAAGAVVVLVASMALLVRSTAGFASRDTGLKARPLWYYDPQTRDLFPSPDSLAPIKAPSDTDAGKPTGLRAYVYACGSCEKKESRFIAYLERFSDEARQRLKEEGKTEYEGPHGIAEVLPERMAALTGADGHEVRGPEADAPWVSADSAAGESMTVFPSNRCTGGEELVACDP